MTRNPAALSAVTWCRHRRPESGNPCSSTTGRPSPVTSYAIPTPSTSTRPMPRLFPPRRALPPARSLPGSWLCRSGGVVADPAEVVGGVAGGREPAQVGVGQAEQRVVAVATGFAQADPDRVHGVAPG